jgi:predicted outer membrane protein
LAFATVATIAAFLPARAQSSVQSRTRQADRRVAATSTASEVPDAVLAAARSGMAAVNVSKIGLQRATDPQLRRFSQKMIDELTKLNQQIEVDQVHRHAL